MTFEEYIAEVARLKRADCRRAGQIYWSVLHEHKTRLAIRIVDMKLNGIDIDPFHSNNSIPMFLEYVCEHWNEY